MEPRSQHSCSVPLILLIAFLATGCNDPSPPGDTAPTPAEHEASSPAVGDTGASPLALNDGKEWQTDDHTRESMRRIVAMVASTPPDSLGRALSGEINQLFAGCTLEGEAHSQLHIFLGDLLAHVTGLYSSESPQERAEEIGAIQNLLITYDEYFE